MAPVVQERVAVLGEVPAMVDFLFLDAPEIDPDAWAKALAGDDGGAGHPGRRHDRLRRPPSATGRPAALHAATLEVAESVGRKLGKAQAPIRVAVTGRRVGPPLFEALEVLGPDRTLARLAAAADRPGRGRLLAAMTAPAGRHRPGPLIPVAAGLALLAVRMLRLLLRLLKCSSSPWSSTWRSRPGRCGGPASSTRRRRPGPSW